RDRGALGILAVAQLHVRSEAAGTARDRQAALRIGSDDAIVFLAILRRLPELPSEIAFRIVRASDEGAEPPTPQRQPPAVPRLCQALRANARVRAVLLGREQIIGE